MKTYTDLEQSKKLTGILPLESADMIYMPMMDIDSMSNSGFFSIPECYPFNEFKDSNNKPLPCWSLAALSEFILPYIADDDGDIYKFYLSKDDLDRWIAYYKSDDASIYICEESDNMIDVILEMVCWLKKEEYI